uniref:Reverse transcriptase domain-containing protein n=1 Tax=Macrostomum lignano TaxID=282301 RepID=A0A1I8F6F6_9PLAT
MAMASESASTGTASLATAVLRSCTAAHGQYLPTQTVSYLRDLTRYLSPRESLVGLNSSQTQLRYYMLERDMGRLQQLAAWPDDLLLSVIIRPSKFQWNFCWAIRDPSGEVIQFARLLSAAIQFRGGPTPRTAPSRWLLTFRLWRESPDNVTPRLARELHEAKLEGREVGRGQQAATASFQGSSATGRATLSTSNGWDVANRRRDFRRRGGGTVSGLEIVPGSTLHLLSDGIGDFFRFRGDVYRLALVSPAKSHSTRQDLKCRVRLPREIPSGPNQAEQSVLPLRPGSGEAEPPSLHFLGATRRETYWAFSALGPAKQRPGGWRGRAPPLPRLFSKLLPLSTLTASKSSGDRRLLQEHGVRDSLQQPRQAEVISASDDATARGHSKKPRGSAGRPPTNPKPSNPDTTAARHLRRGRPREPPIILATVRHAEQAIDSRARPRREAGLAGPRRLLERPHRNRFLSKEKRGDAGPQASVRVSPTASARPVSTPFGNWESRSRWTQGRRGELAFC